MQPSSFRYVNNCLARRRSTVDKLGQPLDENESDRDRMMRPSSYVTTEYDDRLLEVERYKAKFKENKQLVNDARKTSKALADVSALRMKTLRVEEAECIIQKYRDEMDEYRQKGEAFVLAVDLNGDNDSDNEASISEQSQESEDGLGDAEEGGDGDRVETQSDIVKGSASDENDS
ncbi:unnamed protein product [Malus baccata var. baccata]